ncbi:MAG: hypothetical protein Q9170_004720 [Blastenia crenularia]
MPMTSYPSPLKADKAFTCAEIPTIAFNKLIDREPAELAKLLAAGQKEGFFYLDLTKVESQGLYEDYENILAFMKDWFNQPLEEKVKYAYGSDTQGYKPIGTQTGATENSKDGRPNRSHLDRKASSALRPREPHPLQRLHKQNPLPRPRTPRLLLRRVGLLGADRYENHHRDHKPSNSSMTFHRYPKTDARDTSNVGHNKHTDISSLAFLFAQQWGLQVPSTTLPHNGWDYVRPKAGHAIVNVGDSLRFLSGFKLRSVLHRVVPVAEMEHEHRFSIAYFTRPVHGTVFRDSESRVIKADEWFSHKFDVYRQSHREQRMNTVLTAGIEDEKMRARVHVVEEIAV